MFIFSVHSRDSTSIPSASRAMAQENNENISAVLYGIKDFRVEPRPVPEAGPDDLLVRVHSVGICGTDIHFWHHAAFGRIVVKEPMVIGHEASGTVEKVGQNVKNFAAGDRVVMEPNIVCQKCDHCKTGNDNRCEDVTMFGGFARYVTIPQAFCHKLPESVTMEEGALLEPLSCAFHGCRRAGLKQGQKVLICGSGAIGALSLLGAKSFGVSKIVATDISDARLDFIKTLGADCTVNVMGKAPKEAAEAIRQALGAEPDVVLECTGLGMSVETAIHAVKIGGTVCVVGMGGIRADLPILEAICKEIDIKTSLKYNHQEEFATVVKMVGEGKIDLKKVSTAHYKLPDIEQAFKKTMAAEVIKVMVHP
ncbi:alcohol dehydrogenase groES-like domain-containing protein [Ditylenchus destructor]|nr:alcohol dehydrogenase groES-like domain-containing protein [Ditylenchus destructor]